MSTRPPPLRSNTGTNAVLAIGTLGQRRQRHDQANESECTTRGVEHIRRVRQRVAALDDPVAIFRRRSLEIGVGSDAEAAHDPTTDQRRTAQPKQDVAADPPLATSLVLILEIVYWCLDHG